MNVKKFSAPTSREALRKVRESLGPDAVILSNRQSDGGVEILHGSENRVGVEMAANGGTIIEIVRDGAKWLKEGDTIRLYYRGSVGGSDHSDDQVTCVAESRDGINWTRPNLGLVEFRGSKDNNIMWMGQEALAFARRFHNAPTESLGIVKGVMNRAFESERRTVYAQEAMAQAMCRESEFHQEAARRFLAKEPPLYQWADTSKPQT